MNERPRLKIKQTTTDKLLEIGAWTGLVSTWVLTITCYTSLPDRIPLHYNHAGEADGFGDKAFILILPIVATVLVTGLSILNKYPQVFNYSVNITADNALKHYTNATRLLRYLKFILVLIFGYITLHTISNADTQASGLGAWFLPVSLGLIFIPLTYIVIQSFISVRK